MTKKPTYEELEQRVRELEKKAIKRKQVERELLLKNIVFDTSIVANSTADLEGIINQANDSFVRMWGYKSKNEAIGKPILHFVQDEKEAEAIISSLDKTGKWVGEYTARKKDGSTFIANANATILYDETGKKVGYQSSVQDISERKEAEEKLRESEENLTITLNSIGDAVIATDTEGQVVRMNPVAEKLTGWNFSEAKGRILNEVFEIINEETRNTVENPVERVLHEGVVVGLANHTVLIAKDGTEFPIDDSGAPIRNDKGDITGVVLIFRDVTEIRQTARDLRAAQKELETIIDSIPAFIAYKDTNNRYIRINKVYADFVNLPREAIEGKSAFDITQNRELAESYWQDDREVIESGIPKRGIIERFVADETIWIQTDKIPYRDEQGNIIGVIAFFVDITSRLEAEEALKESEERLKQAQKLARIGHWDWEMETNELHWSEEAFHIFGQDPKKFQVSVETFESAIHPDDFQKFLAEREQALIEDRDVSIEHRIIHPDGTILHVHEIASMVRDKKGDIIKVTGTVQDISERKKAEETLRNSEEHYRILVETASRSGQAIVMLQDMGGIEASVVFANDTAVHITGYTWEEIAKLSWHDIIHPNYQDAARERYRKRIGGEDIPGLFEISIFGKDGTEIPIEITSIRMEFEGERALVAFFRDIIERKQAEEEKKKLEAQLQHAQKMEAIGTLAGGIAHDFNNILGAIIGCSELALLDIPSDNPANGHMRQVLNSGNRAKDLGPAKK